MINGMPITDDQLEEFLTKIKISYHENERQLLQEHGTDGNAFLRALHDVCIEKSNQMRRVIDDIQGRNVQNETIKIGFVTLQGFLLTRITDCMLKMNWSKFREEGPLFEECRLLLEPFKQKAEVVLLYTYCMVQYSLTFSFDITGSKEAMRVLEEAYQNATRFEELDEETPMWDANRIFRNLDGTNLHLRVTSDFNQLIVRERLFSQLTERSVFTNDVEQIFKYALIGIKSLKRDIIGQMCLYPRFFHCCYTIAKTFLIKYHYAQCNHILAIGFIFLRSVKLAMITNGLLEDVNKWEAKFAFLYTLYGERCVHGCISRLATDDLIVDPYVRALHHIQLATGTMEKEFKPIFHRKVPELLETVKLVHMWYYYMWRVSERATKYVSTDHARDLRNRLSLNLSNLHALGYYVTVGRMPIQLESHQAEPNHNPNPQPNGHHNIDLADDFDVDVNVNNVRFPYPNANLVRLQNGQGQHHVRIANFFRPIPENQPPQAPDEADLINMNIPDPNDEEIMDPLVAGAIGGQHFEIDVGFDEANFERQIEEVENLNVDNGNQE